MGRGFKSEVVVGLAVLVLFVVCAIFFGGPARIDRVQSLRSWQEADSPPGYPIGKSESDPEGRIPEFDRTFVLQDAFERFRLPPLARLDYPMGSEQGALTYDAQPFLEKNSSFGDRFHLGSDLNGIGGMNTDLGDPVVGAGNGVVLFAADQKGGWGNIVILGHRDENGRHVCSLYGHLQSIEVVRGALVARGQKIGTVGTAGGKWPAHLHFEIYEGPLIDPGGGGYAYFSSNRLNAPTLLADFRPSAPDDLAPEPLAVFEGPERSFDLGGGSGPTE